MKRVIVALLIVIVAGCSHTTKPTLDSQGALRSDAFDPQGRLVEAVIQKPDGVSIVESYDPVSGLQVAAVLLNPDGSKIVTTHPGGARKTIHKHLDPLGDATHSVIVIRNTDGKMLEQQVLDAEGKLREKTVYQRDMGTVIGGTVTESVTYLYGADGKLKNVINSAPHNRADG